MKLSDATAYAQIAIAIATVGAVVFAAAQLGRFHRSACEDRSYAYFDRYVDWDFALHVSSAVSHARWGNLKALT